MGSPRSLRRPSTVLSTCLLALLVPCSALADVVSPPRPIECPDGAAPSTNHCGTICLAPACQSDAECEAGEACMERPLCVEADVPCGGWGATYSIVRGACPDEACAVGACQPVRSCGPREATSDAAGTGRPVSHACGCRAAGAGGSQPALMLLLALGIALVGLRRAGRR